MVDVLRILWPTDFSNPSKEAGRYAVTLANQFGAELHALHVIEDIAPSMLEAARRMATSPDYTAQARELGEKELAASLPSDVAGGREVVRAIQFGAPLTHILDYAKEQDIGLIVIGTHGLRGLQRFLIGSVAERVVRHAPCPVLTVRPPAPAD